VHYRLYQLSAITGGIVSGTDIEAGSDEEAVAHAQAIHAAEGAPFELWRGASRIFAHEGGAAAPN
jgi:hypothetical protein